MQERTKNILIVCHYYPPHIGGIEIAAFNQATLFASVGHKVTVITSHVGGDQKEETIEGVRIVRVRAWNYFEKWSIPFPLFSPQLWSTLSRVTKTADIVHVHDALYISSFLGALAAWLYNKPMVLTQHVGLVKYPSGIVMFVQRAVYATWGAFVFRNSEKIVVYNTIVKEFLINRHKINSSKVLELRNGIDLSIFYPARTGEKLELRHHFGLPLLKPIVLFVGRLVPKKGFTTLVAARDNDYDIVFAGSGKGLDQWLKTPGIHVMGSMNQAELAKLYRAADVFVFPAEGEMFTLAMQEAMASGLPVITTDEKGYEKYDLDRDLIAFVPPTSYALKKNIERLIANKELREKMSSYSSHLAKNWFDCDINSESVLKLYSNLS